MSAFMSSMLYESELEIWINLELSDHLNPHLRTRSGLTGFCTSWWHFGTLGEVVVVELGISTVNGLTQTSLLPKLQLLVGALSTLVSKAATTETQVSILTPNVLARTVDKLVLRRRHGRELPPLGLSSQLTPLFLVPNGVLIVPLRAWLRVQTCRQRGGQL